AAWARRVLDTPLMVLPRRGGPWDAPDGLTFADWIGRRKAARTLPPPTTADLDYHLSTLFTPVRPHGYLEIRYLDAQPVTGWLAPAALLVALLQRPDTVDRVLEICAPVAGRWADAARCGLSDPDIAAAARRVVDLGSERLSDVDLPADTVTDVARTAHRRVHEGRAPGDRKGVLR
ncbi:glutamate-cysteine ligase family protein, partial [Saccharomonospora iraqiensis]|uniref:glutamate-cysteine ligase family protein n=1 Tax=Saccharomonospora iraqiensis TaxID=52698 RepID=UPI00022E11C8